MSETPKNTIVTLHVKTASITQENKNEKVTFTDNRGDVEIPGDPANYVSIVDGNFTITWEGKNSNSGQNDYYIVMAGVEKEGGSDLVDLPPTYSNAAREMSCNVKNDVASGTEESYSVSFKIKDANGRMIGQKYTIDPKMKMR